MSATADLAAFLANSTATAPPPGMGKTAVRPPITFTQGVVVSWNPDTGENVIEVSGVPLADLPMMNVSEALLIGPGHVVGLLRVGLTYLVLGRIAAAGGAGFTEIRDVLAGDATTTAGALNQNQNANTDSGYVVDGSGVTFRTYTGRWLIQLTAQLELSGERAAARFSYRTLGAQVIDASNDRAAMINDDGGGMGVTATVTYANVHEGDSGLITVDPAFRLTSGPTFASAAIWTNRTVIVRQL